MVRTVGPTWSVRSREKQSASGRLGTGGGLFAIGGYGELAGYGGGPCEAARRGRYGLP